MATEGDKEGMSVENDEPQSMQIESLCVNCYANGTTRLMVTDIPFYKEVVVMSFSCDACGYENNELKSCGVIAEKGVRICLKVFGSKDLNRKCIRTEYASISIPEVELEISPKNQKGEVTTLEGIIDRVIAGLQQDQDTRRIQHSEDAAKIDQYILKLLKTKNVDENGPFTFVIEDISGNSFVENFMAPSKDPHLSISYFERNENQNHELGFFTHQEVGSENNKGENISSVKDGLLQPIQEGEYNLEQLQHGEIFTFRTNCPDCNAPCDTNMKMTNIPHFKEVVIMATNCESCGHRTNEVKSGSGIEEKGVRIEVKIRSKLDFSRDILKSDTCSLMIPELELESGPRSLCGRFTTAEGLIASMKEQLVGKESMLVGDSTDPETVERMDKFTSKLDKILEGKLSITLILDDPAGNSYVQTLNDDGNPDEGLKIIKYIRNYDQNEELGLNDMKTENYAE